MPQSTFAANGTQFIDAIDPTYAPASIWNLGVVYLGGSKSAVRRCLGRFDVYGTAASGRPLTASDVLTSAELALETTSVAGPSGWPARIERITRAEWDHTTANWTRYRVANNWTVAGGDVATPPAALPFISPSAGGEFVISGVLPFVTDAIANRAGLLLLRVKADDEEPAQSQWCAFDGSLVSSARPRLRVTYTAAVLTPVDRPGDEPGSAAIAAAAAGRPSAPGQPARPDQPATRAEAATGGPRSGTMLQPWPLAPEEENRHAHNHRHHSRPRPAGSA